MGYIYTNDYETLWEQRHQPLQRSFVTEGSGKNHRFPRGVWRINSFGLLALQGAAECGKHCAPSAPNTHPKEGGGRERFGRCGIYINFPILHTHKAILGSVWSGGRSLFATDGTLKRYRPACTVTPLIVNCTLILYFSLCNI